MTLVLTITITIIMVIPHCQMQVMKHVLSRSRIFREFTLKQFPATTAAATIPTCVARIEFPRVHTEQAVPSDVVLRTPPAGVMASRVFHGGGECRTW
jgi:hypothetical protein